MTNENTGTTRESTSSEASGRTRLERIAMAYAVIVIGGALLVLARAGAKRIGDS